MVRDAQLHKRSCSRNGSSSDPQGISSSPAAAGAKQESEPHRPATRDASLRPCVPKDKSPGWGLLAKNAAKGRGDDDAQYHAANDDHDLLLLGRGGGGGKEINSRDQSLQCQEALSMQRMLPSAHPRFGYRNWNSGVFGCG